MPARRFPPPWTIEEYNDACFVVTDSAGQQLAYVNFEEEPGRRIGREAAHLRRGRGTAPGRVSKNGLTAPHRFFAKGNKRPCSA
jgi:hypothetical protein